MSGTDNLEPGKLGERRMPIVYDAAALRIDTVLALSVLGSFLPIETFF